MSGMNRKQLVAAAAVLLLVPTLSWGAGFALFEHGNKAMAMGGAFTAVANDPSAVYWNAAGLAFQNDKGVQFMAGATFINASQDFTGESPYPGAGYTASQKSQIFFPPHAYLVYPINDTMTLGVGVLTPFGLGTWWKENFAGRFISKRVDLKLYDFTPTLAIKVSDDVAVAVGIDYTIGQIDLTKGIGVINPYTQRLADVGQVHMYTDGASNTAFGWNASIFAKLGSGFTAGVMYRSQIDMDLDGYGSFTQYPTGYADFDAALGAMVPFGQKTPLKTKIKFPDYLSVGLAWQNAKWTVSGQVGFMGWSSFQNLPINFTEHPELSTTVEEGYKDTTQYRLGVEYRVNPTWSLRAGALHDETPQPPASMSPLLGDGTRKGYSAGVGWTNGKVSVDVGDLYLVFDKRSTGGMSFDGYEGSYDTSANLFGVTFGVRF